MPASWWAGRWRACSRKGPEQGKAAPAAAGLRGRGQCPQARLCLTRGPGWDIVLLQGCEKEQYVEQQRAKASRGR